MTEAITFHPKFLTRTAPGIWFLDHRLTPEVRAMFCAMSSRLPAGGISARYMQVIDAVAEGLWEKQSLAAPDYSPNRPGPTWEDIKRETDDAYLVVILEEAEDRLCEYPLHPKVQTFFDQFVLRYGHSSIMELTGSPSVYVEGVSYWAAFKSFDNPQVAGQEFSTRAVRHADWPMALECYTTIKGMYGAGEPEFVGKIPPREDIPLRGPIPAKWADIEMKEVDITVPHPTLAKLHNEWFAVFPAEVEAWRVHLTDPVNRAALNIKDKEPFRPALDHSRWSIPGTIATGFAHTANLRTMARVIHDGQMLAKQSGAPAVIRVWDGIAQGYAAAVPGLAEMGLREAVYDSPSNLDFHAGVHGVYQSDAPDDVVVKTHILKNAVPPLVRGRKFGENAYLDPFFNHFARVDIAYQCSLAVARDWHRHRTLMPWCLDIVWSDDDLLQLHHAYEPRSELGKAKLAELLKLSTDAYREFIEAGDPYRAMLCLPLGTKVRMSGQGGLRDVVYMLELRAFATGANFEYKDQALRALALLTEQLGATEVLGGTPIPINLPQVLGLAA